GGSYALTFTATNAAAAATAQPFPLTVFEIPRVTSLAFATFTVGTAGTFTVTTTGFPRPAITVAGTLPSGVTFVDNGNGAAVLSGTPSVGAGGTYPLTFTATNARGSGTQAFTLGGNEEPTDTNAS